MNTNINLLKIVSLMPPFLKLSPPMLDPLLKDSVPLNADWVSHNLSYENPLSYMCQYFPGLEYDAAYTRCL